MTKYEWIKEILAGNKDVPIAQHWMSFFNGAVAKKLSPPECHYPSMWLYDAPEDYDVSPMGPAALDQLIAFNAQTGRCFACLGKGANVSFGHGGPGEFFCRTLQRGENEIIAEYETGVRAKVQFHPHFYHVYDHPIKNLADVDKLVLPDPTDPARYAGFAQDVAYLKAQGEYVVASLNGFFSGLHYFLMEYTETLMSLLTDPPLIAAMVERLGQWNLAAARKMMEAGAHCITLCDDLGSKKAMLMAPDLYRQFFKPWHKQLCELVHEMGGDVHLHSHGAIGPILDDLVECGFDFINPFDPEEKHELEAVLQKYATKFVIVGGFPTTFWDWPAEKQNVFMKQTADLGRRYGRLIFMDSGGVPETVSLEDFQRINQVSREVRGVNGVPGCI